MKDRRQNQKTEDSVSDAHVEEAIESFDVESTIGRVVPEEAGDWKCEVVRRHEYDDGLYGVKNRRSHIESLKS
jgi:hypothetical protein